MANRFIVIRAHDFTVDTAAYFAQDLAEAQATKARLEIETEREWKIAAVL